MCKDLFSRLNEYLINSHFEDAESSMREREKRKEEGCGSPLHTN